MKTSYFSNNVIVHSNKNAGEIIKESEVTEMLLAGRLETLYTSSYKVVQVRNVPGVLCSENADACCVYKVMEQHNPMAY